MLTASKILNFLSLLRRCSKLIFFVYGGRPFCTSWSKNWYSSECCAHDRLYPSAWSANEFRGLCVHVHPPYYSLSRYCIPYFMQCMYMFIMEKRLARQYYSPNDYWKGLIWSNQKISLGCESLWKCCEAVALQAGSLTDLPPRTEANSSPEIWRSHTQQGPPGGPHFYAARQTAPRAQRFQIRAHRCRRGQPLQRSWASDFTKFWWSCEGFSDNIQAVAVEMASNTAGWPRAQINGRCHKRNGQAQNIYLTRARWNSPRPGHCWTFQPHPGWALVQAPVRRGNATSWGAAVHCLGWKTSKSCFGFEQRGDKPYRHETRRRHQRKSCLCKAINTLFQACWRKRKITPLPCPSSLSLPTWRAWRGCKTGHRPNLVF